MKNELLIAAISALPFSGNAQLKNMDFEDWISNGSRFKPVGWIWTNLTLVDSNATFYYEPEKQSQNNKYALKLSVWYNYTKDAALQVAPIQSRPTALKGYYKYTDNVLSDPAGDPVPDTAQVSVFLTKWNAQTKQSDTIGRGVLDLNGAEHYRQFSCNVSYLNNKQPDSIHILLDCSRMRKVMSLEARDSGIASFFTVDNLVLDDGTLGVGNIHEQGKVKVYPNPTYGIVYLDGFTGSVAVYNMNGIMVSQAQELKAGEHLSVEKLPAGIYILHMNGKENIQRTMLVKQ